MGEFSLSHILIIAVIFLIFFGPSRLPQLGQSLGKAIKGFKQGLNEIDADSKDVTQQQQAQRNVSPQQLNQGQAEQQGQTQTEKKTENV